MWTCPLCGERNEDQFTHCWKCTPADEEAVRRAPAGPEPRSNEEWPEVFGIPPPAAPAPEEPVVSIGPEGTVRCPACGDIFRVGPPPR